MTPKPPISPTDIADKNSSEAFEQIYREHYNRLFTLAFRLTGTVENAEDVLQTAFTDAFAAFSRFRFESTAYTWLYRIVFNGAMAYLTKWRQMPTDEWAESRNMSVQAVYDYINGFGNVEDDVLTHRIRESCLQMFINCMPAKYRTVYTLRGMLQLSVKDTAEILEISEDSVKTRLSRARQLAKSHLEGRCGLAFPGAMCHCRGFAGYITHNHREHKLQNIKVVRRLEEDAAQQFKTEMREVLNVDRLFATELESTDFNSFKERLKSLVQKGTLTVLSS
ncbi:MAG: sigma-70 family RNA polymerase sigma factor [Deltaproteobacteria bacterium]|nr:sigma-70 family RNA polymerase sigma factor [Deltaproteobacteria bacterium]